VVLDFAANTRSQRAWFRQLLDPITAYFQPPADDEGFTVIRHPRG
jgi:hypothetical protein